MSDERKADTGWVRWPEPTINLVYNGDAYQYYPRAPVTVTENDAALQLAPCPHCGRTG